MQYAVKRFKDEVGALAWLRLESRLEELNRDVARRGIIPFESHADLLTGYSYGEFYDWDLYFENIYLSYYGISRYCRSNMEVFLDKQLECGFVARTLIVPRYRQHFKPFLAQIAVLGSRQTKRFDWLAGKYYDRLKKYLDYWFWYTDLDKNGLCVWNSADHSGMDNQNSRAGVMDTDAVEGVDLNTYLVRELQAMQQIASALGKKDEAAEFEKRAGALADKINEVLWDEKDGFYYDRNERTGEMVRVKSVAGFLPLWAGIVPEDRTKRLVDEHLTNPKEFWLKYPIPTYAKTEPDYYQLKKDVECNWRGPTWIPTNYMVFHGLRKSGYNELAKELAYKTFDLVLSEETTREYYDAETGVGQGLNPFWGWSSLAYLMPLEYELDYDPTDLDASQIKSIGDLLSIQFPKT